MRDFQALLLIFTIGSITAITGCAAKSSDEISSDGAAVSTEATARADSLLVEAERLAKEHLGGAYCETGDATTANILAKLRESVSENPSRSFALKIRTNRTLREAVGQTLEFAKLTGIVTVDGADVNGVAKAAAEGPIEVYGPAPGVYGNMAKLVLRAKGKATLKRLELDANGTPSWSETALTYAVRHENDETLVVLDTPTGKQTLVVDYVPATADAPERFVLEGTDGATTFDSLPSECEA